MIPPDITLALKVLTVNTHKGFTFFNRRFILPELRDAIRGTDADIVFLQEVIGSNARHARKHLHWPDSSQFEFLADSIWQDFAYGRNAVYPHGDHGNAVMSKFPITRYNNLDVSSAGAREKRGMLHCVVQLPDGRSLHAVCVHLGLLERHRLEQLNQLCELIDEEVPPDDPLLVAGDFNDWRLRAQPFLMTRCGLEEVFHSRWGQVARTFPARFPLLRLDRIYVRNVRVFEPVRLSGRPWSHLSDHAPLAAQVGL